MHGRIRGLDEIQSHDQCVFLRNRAAIHEARLVPHLHDVAALGIEAHHAVAIAPVEPAAIGLSGEELIRLEAFLGLELAELQNSLALGQLVMALIGILNAVEEAGL